MLAEGKRRDDFFDSEGSMKQVGDPRVPGSMDLRRVLQTNDKYLVDFVMRALTWRPEERMTAAQAMQHPWIRMKEVQLSSRPEGKFPGLRQSM
jgi:serine/threonine protein kinase